ncbi:hypothetical protein SOVF_063080 [Spinacia oleracea]|nr:hypothetical protein SOVF_063080 [Spinacia oleracea]
MASYEASQQVTQKFMEGNTSRRRMSAAMVATMEMRLELISFGELDGRTNGGGG